MPWLKPVILKLGGGWTGDHERESVTKIMYVHIMELWETLKVAGGWGNSGCLAFASPPLPPPDLFSSIPHSNVAHGADRNGQPAVDKHRRLWWLEAALLFLSILL